MLRRPEGSKTLPLLSGSLVSVQRPGSVHGYSAVVFECAVLVVDPVIGEVKFVAEVAYRLRLPQADEQGVFQAVRDQSVVDQNLDVAPISQ